MTKIFINYRTGDETFAAVTLDDRLRKRFGEANVFRDSRSIKPGIDFEPMLWRNLARSSVLLVVIGPRWLTGTATDGNRLTREDDFVRREIALAFQVGVRVVPVLVGDVSMPAAEDLPEEIRKLRGQQYLRVHARNAKYDIQRVVDELARMLGEDGPEPADDDADREGQAQDHVLLLLRIEDLDARTDPVQVALRAAAYECALGAVKDSGLASDVIVHDNLDGVLILAPVERNSSVIMAADVVPALNRRLAAHAAESLRLRAALHQGLVTRDGHGWSGAALYEIRRLLDEPALSGVFRAMSAQRLVLVISDTFHRQVIWTGQKSLDKSTMSRIPLSISSADAGTGRYAWVQAPGRPAPLGLPADAEETVGGPPVVDERTRRASTRSYHIDTVNGNVGFAENVNGDFVLGDKVAGSKTVYR